MVHGRLEFDGFVGFLVSAEGVSDFGLSDKMLSSAD